MIQLLLNEQEWLACASVATNADISGVRLVAVSVEGAERVSESELPVSLNIDAKCDEHRFIEPNLLQVRVSTKVKFVSVEADQTEDLASITVTYRIDYRTTPNPPEAVLMVGFPTFAKYNAVYNCWPYMRQQIHQLVSEMGLSCLLPLMTVRKRPKEPEAPTSS